MRLKKIPEVFLALSLLLCFFGGVTTVVRADDEKRISNRKGCHDYDKDRNAAEDEEKSAGDCEGTVPTPEPVSIILFTAGLAGVGFAARRRLRKSE